MKFWKPLPSGVIAMMLCLSAFTFSTSGSVAHAQNRTLPDFTDLVEQVGPSVVNIRTIERARLDHRRAVPRALLETRRSKNSFGAFLAFPCPMCLTLRVNSVPTDHSKKKSNPVV